MKIPENSLKDRVALVTGGSSGIGKASAIAFAQAGARVAILSRNEDKLKKTARKIEQTGSEALILLADISDPEAMTEAIRKIEKTWSRLDILVANAGINGTWAPLDRLSFEDWQQTIGINLTGTFITVKTALPLLKKQGGSIIVTSSVNGTRMFSNTGASAYATSKAGQVAFARMMALELAKFRIRINTICPGAIDTAIDDSTDAHDLDDIRPPVEFPEGQVPLTDGKPGSSKQVADTIWFLASDGASHITGAEIFIDGAQSLFQG